MAERGKFIVFEGIDGSGKSRQTKKLGDYLKTRGLPIMMTGEHTRGTLIGGVIDEVVTDNRTNISLLALQLLFLADRQSHVDELIKPAVIRGDTVICDRYKLSTPAYALPEHRERLWKISRELKFMTPDLTFFLEVTVDEALRRLAIARGEMTIFEKRTSLENALNGYGWCFNQMPVAERRNLVIIDGMRPIDEVFGLITNEIGKRKLT